MCIDEKETPMIYSVYLYDSCTLKLIKSSRCYQQNQHFNGNYIYRLKFVYFKLCICFHFDQSIKRQDNMTVLIRPFHPAFLRKKGQD